MSCLSCFPRSALAVALLAGASIASAEIRGGAGVSYVDLGSGTSLSLGTAALDVAGGWRFDVSDAFNVSPEARFLTGIGDASSGGVTSSLRTSYGAQVRLQYDFRGGPYLFATPSYTRMTVRSELDFSTQQNGGSVSVRESEWLWSISTGLGINFTERFATEVRYERTESVAGSALDFYGVALRYHF